MESNLQRFGVSVASDLLSRFDRLIASKGYTNRSEALRDLIREYLTTEDWSSGSKEAVGTITLIYNHQQREMSDKLTDLQHQHHDQIISVLHVHLDAHNCLEVLVVKGKKAAIQTVADRLASTKGVKHCKLVIATTGVNL
jgi:CopG family nickel-responsive transcriptional regulator